MSPESRAPGPEGLAFDRDGALLLSSTWSGPVVGVVGQTWEELPRKNGGQTASLGYDHDGLLTTIALAGSPTLTLGHDASHGLPTGGALGAVTTSVGYSAFGERSSDSATFPGGSYSNTYPVRDKLGRIRQKVETIGGVATTYDYTYTAAGQLDTVSINNAVVRDYDYDLNGNRTKDTPGGPVIAGYDAQDRLVSYAGRSYGYTRSGELASKTDAGQTTLYGYDPLGNLRTVTQPSGEQIAYVIDGLNRRVGKRVCPAPCTGGAQPVLQQGFLYSDSLRIVAELDGSSAVVSRFVYGESANVPELMVRGTTTYKLVTDHIGSVRLVVDASTGAVAQRTDYDEFGNVTSETLASGFSPVPFGFAGGLYDRDTKLVRFGARDYDPQVGRWTSKDPIRFAAGVPQLYEYAAGDSINLIDPDGRIVPVLVAAAAVLVGSSAVAVVGVEAALGLGDLLAAAFGRCPVAKNDARTVTSTAVNVNMAIAAGLTGAGVVPEVLGAGTAAVLANPQAVPAALEFAAGVVLPPSPPQSTASAIGTFAGVASGLLK